MQRIALKIDVDTLRGTLEGVPALADTLIRAGCDASFFFSVGPDNTGRALRRIFRPGFLAKVRRTSVVTHYGWRTLTRGVLWPGPHIARRAGSTLRAIRDQGFEVGVHAYDHVRWQDQVTKRGESWTSRELARACLAFRDALGAPPEAHAAAGWQLNPATLWLETEMAFRYASDTRGHEPFLPSWGKQEGFCPQLPTTLPTLDELIGLNDRTPDEAARDIVRQSQLPLAQGHVFTLHAELEGMALLRTFQDMLAAWRALGFQLVAMRDLFASLDLGALPRHQIRMQPIAGRSGVLATQAERVPAHCPLPIAHSA
jgi:undecaprenyl phosphate-alpha-L-ara4FN deformylase